MEMKFLQIENIEADLWVKWFCHFPWKYNFSSLTEWHMDQSLFIFAFKSAFNLPTKALE